MRVVIFCDMEGVAGITNWAFVDHDSARYEEGRRLYTGEINAAVRGCKAADVTEIFAVDGHGAGGACSFRSWLPETLEPGARYVMGYPWARFVEPMRDGQCDALLFVGAHAMAGTPDGGMSHTVYAQGWYNAWVNGTLVGESGLIAAVAGEFGVPTAFLSGDEATCKEITDLLGPKVATAAVKRSLSRYSADTLCHKDACAMIASGVERALRAADFAPAWKIKPPVELKIQLATPDRADEFYQHVGVEREDARTLVATGGSFWEVWDRFWPGVVGK